jgi:hypothetical protein
LCTVAGSPGAARRAAYSVITGVVVTVGFITSSIGFDQTEPLAGVAGLLQRLTVATGWAW